MNIGGAHENEMALDSYLVGSCAGWERRPGARGWDYHPAGMSKTWMPATALSRF
jgi:hypothetical protein